MLDFCPKNVHTHIHGPYGHNRGVPHMTKSLDALFEAALSGDELAFEALAEFTPTPPRSVEPPGLRSARGSTLVLTLERCFCECGAKWDNQLLHVLTAEGHGFYTVEPHHLHLPRFIRERQRSLYSCLSCFGIERDAY